MLDENKVKQKIEFLYGADRTEQIYCEIIEMLNIKQHFQKNKRSQNPTMMITYASSIIDENCPSRE